MSDDSQQLESLWRQQQTLTPDMALLKKTWRRVKLKQRLYLILDILACLMGPFILLWVYQDLSSFQKYWVITVIIFTLGFTAYLIWLRRFSLMSKKSATGDYLELLKSQYRQNVKIAHASKLSVYALPPIFACFLAAAYWLDGIETDKLINKTLLICGIFIVFLPTVWVWADKRAKRFKRELAKLESMASL